MNLSAVPVWRVFENFWINQIVYMLTLAPAVWTGFVLIGWWGVPVSIGVTFAAWQLLIWRLWILRGKPREAYRYAVRWRPPMRLIHRLEWFGIVVLLCAIAGWEALIAPGMIRGIVSGQAYNGEPLSGGERGGYALGLVLFGVLPVIGWLKLMVVRRKAHASQRSGALSRGARSSANRPS